MEDFVAVEVIGTDNVVRIPRGDLRLRVGANGILFQSDEVLVFESMNRGLYDVPGGGIKPGESLQEALCREFREESGVEVRPLRLLHVAERYIRFLSEPHPWHAVRIYYLVEQVGGEIIPQGNGDDSRNVRFVPIGELHESNTIRCEILEAIRIARLAGH